MNNQLRGTLLCIWLGVFTAAIAIRPSAPCLLGQEPVSQEPVDSNPTPLFGERTEDQVAELLANAPPGPDDGQKPGLKIFYFALFPAGQQLAYLLASCACLCMLVPGACSIFFGLQSRTINQQTVTQIAVVLSALSLTWVMFLFSIAFSRNAHSYDIQAKEIQVLDRESAPGNLFIGDLANVGMNGMLSEWGGGAIRHPVRRLGDTIPHTLFMTFQMMLFLQAITPLLVATCPRQSTWVSLPLWLMWSALVYAPLCYWTRGGGWLGDCVDAGASVPMHVGVGFTALGLRLASRRDEAASTMAPAVVPLLIGAILLLGGNLLVAACRSVAQSPWPTLDFLNVFLGGSCGLLLWQLFAQRGQRAVVCDWPVGMIAGIVSVSAGSSSMSPSSAIVAAALGVFACRLTLRLVDRRQDILWQLFAIYGVSGYVGLALTGVFSSTEIAGADLAGNAIVGLIGGNTELLRVQLLTASVAAFLAALAGAVLPTIARVIGLVLERLFAGKPNPEKSLSNEAHSHV